MAVADITIDILRAAASVLYIWVGTIVWRRTVDNAEDRRAMRAFASWWLGLAAIGVASIPTSFGWNIAESGVMAFRVWVYVVILVIYVALGGLMYYLLYVYTGRPGVIKGVIAYYIALTVFLVAFIELQEPYVGIEDGETAILYAKEAPAIVGLVFSLGLTLPILLGAGAYAALYWKVNHRESRYRIILVSGGLLIWFSFSVATSVTSFATGSDEQSLVVQMISQSLGLLAAALVVLAFKPPGALRRWLDAGHPAEAA